MLILGRKVLHYGLCTWGGINSLTKNHGFLQQMLQFEMEVLERAAEETSCFWEGSSLPQRTLCRGALLVEGCSVHYRLPELQVFLLKSFQQQPNLFQSKQKSSQKHLTSKGIWLYVKSIETIHRWISSTGMLPHRWRRNDSVYFVSFIQIAEIFPRCTSYALGAFSTA